MQENIEKIKQTILSIAKLPSSIEDKLNQYNNLLAGLNPSENGEEMVLVCDAGIYCANKLNKPEMVAQFFLIKAKAEIAKEAFLIHELKNLTLALGWFAFALKSEKEHCEKLERRIQEIWSNTQKYIDAGFTYLNKSPYVGPAGYCYEMAGEIYASFYLQAKLYHMGSGRPWRSRIANFKFVRFLNIDDLLLVNKKARRQIYQARYDSLKCLNRALKYFKQEKAWTFLANCYISLGLEYHSFNSPTRSKLALFKAQKLIKKYKILGLDERLKSIKRLPLIGSDRD